MDKPYQKYPININKVVCGPNSQIWGKDWSGKLFTKQGKNSDWQNIPDQRIGDISVSMNGIVWVVGTDDKQVYSRTGVSGEWQQLDNPGNQTFKRIGAHDKFLYATTTDDHIWYRSIDGLLTPEPHQNQLDNTTTVK